MAENITRLIQFKSQSGGETSPADMHVVAFLPQEQKFRAIKSMLTFWLIAAVCVLIPIAHFILVPGFFIGGIIVASRRWNAAEEGRDATGTCPACGKQISISLDKNPELPQWHNCPECSCPLELQPSAQVDAGVRK
jgi:hypothetical protein